MSDNKSQRKPYYNNHYTRRSHGFGLITPPSNIVVSSNKLLSYGIKRMEVMYSASRLTKRLLDFHLKRGRWKSKKRRPLKIDQFLDNGLKHIRSGVYAGSQDDRPIRCSMRGIKHLFYVAPSMPCMCRWCTLKPSPLRSEITPCCNESPYNELTIKWSTNIHQYYIGEEAYERQHNTMIKIL
ncbi:uncharacterized protein Ecym_7138 [Eremothecium cymbalariae DBVPG|uniref:Uncharacterized protein n=1 Tax=Eremothecium cymbalariae (strain CBS 270.75 / DBVPG 7215 / KCTC 17166 / NRRL Y-17582) TaxID=931890 RepID=G8JVX2_ERECY|nr:hypothetical protein Ecym_7138 [Eremothecium cymbalariae DBVPG\